jgi:hypothetical protein
MSEAVDITVVVKRHVPGYLQSQKSSDEIPIAKEGISRKFPRWTSVAILFCAVTLFAGTVSWTLIDRNRQAIAAARIAAQAPPPVNALQAITGVWGSKYDSQLSCAQNPHTISLVKGDRELSIRFAKPVWDSTKTIDGVEYTIIGSEPNKLVLSQDSPGDSFAKPLRWYVRFADMDTYEIRRSDRPSKTSGDFIRCH